LVAVSTDDPSVVGQFLSDGGVAVDGIYQSNLEPLGIMGTPTVLVVNAHGKVEEEFLGKLSDAGERKLLAVLGSPGAGETRPEKR